MGPRSAPNRAPHRALVLHLDGGAGGVAWGKLCKGQQDCQKEQLGSVFGATQEAVEKMQDFAQRKTWDPVPDCFWLPMDPASASASASLTSSHKNGTSLHQELVGPAMWSPIPQASLCPEDMDRESHTCTPHSADHTGHLSLVQESCSPFFRFTFLGRHSPLFLKDMPIFLRLIPLLVPV